MYATSVMYGNTLKAIVDTHTNIIYIYNSMVYIRSSSRYTYIGIYTYVSVVGPHHSSLHLSNIIWRNSLQNLFKIALERRSFLLRHEVVGGASFFNRPTIWRRWVHFTLFDSILIEN